MNKGRLLRVLLAILIAGLVLGSITATVLCASSGDWSQFFVILGYVYLATFVGVAVSIFTIYLGVWALTGMWSLSHTKQIEQNNYFFSHNAVDKQVQQEVSRKVYRQTREKLLQEGRASLKPPTVGPKGGAGDSGASKR